MIDAHSLFKAHLKTIQIPGTALYNDTEQALYSLESLILDFEEYEPPPIALRLQNLVRKWELVSAFQKAVRRGDAAQAVRLAGAMASILNQPKELEYLRRRVAVTSAEDMGPANHDLMVFVLMGMSVFPVGKFPEVQHKFLAFIAKAMAESPRSRMYCALGNIRNTMEVLKIKEPENAAQAAALATPGEDSDCWATKTGWRTEKLSTYSEVVEWHWLTQDQLTLTMPPVQLIAGLPEYAYDSHTRVGSLAIRVLAKRLQEHLSQATGGPLKEVHDLVGHKFATLASLIGGYLMFYLEGAVILPITYYCKEVAEEELRLYMRTFKLDLWHWEALSKWFSSEETAQDLRSIREWAYLKNYT